MLQQQDILFDDLASEATQFLKSIQSNCRDLLSLGINGTSIIHLLVIQYLLSLRIK